ncbi:sulfur carrier protein ThiS [Oceanirhabdus sp. W0125-5]|uniref:sulfur carrier protein ThiS n=1 Tax=Oceanirhabdus sp. W0125-5 TaxID=2999116 RepID=UPI0022F30E7D|nr:sulfur carrier protein ThiS [Oceanirhabdus sp. W0125-5]WBW99777.1 sulfur carrier protein ThiS [Oceanirhabdus sp. W0125-5]
MVINGKERDYSNILLKDLITELNLVVDQVVVEVDEKIISKELYGELMLDGREKIEIVGFIGGG